MSRAAFLLMTGFGATPPLTRHSGGGQVSPRLRRSATAERVHPIAVVLRRQYADPRRALVGAGRDRPKLVESDVARWR